MPADHDPAAPSGHGVYPASLRIAEREALASRHGGAAPGGVAPTTGVALSGGGIRSATLSLGFFQGLAAADLIRRVDILSTVSGGGYFGTFLGGLFLRARLVDPAATPNDHVRDVLRNGKSFEIDWLRNNGRYLAPNNSGDMLLGAAVILRNWFAVAVVLGVFCAALSLLTLVARTLFLEGPGWPLLGTSRLAWGFWWSPWLLVAGLIGALVVLPMNWVYWLGPLPRRGGDGDTAREIALLWTWVVPVAVLVVGGFTLPFGAPHPWVFDRLGVAFPAILSRAATLIPSITLLLGVFFSVLRPQPDGYANATSVWFSRLFWLTAGLAGFALVDSLGETVAWYLREVGATGTAAIIAAAVMSLIALVQKLKPVLAGAATQAARRLAPAILFGALAIALAAILLVAVSATTHAIAFDPGGRDQISATRSAVFFAIALIVAFLAGRAFVFVNQSSLHAMYAARLGRAYLGASNPARRSAVNQRITDEVPGDELHLRDYAPEKEGGPLHLINVTINETIDGQYQVEYRDRKGLPMAVSHAGVSVGAKHHATWTWPNGGLTAVEGCGFDVWQPGAVAPEQLLVGRWAAISGAAVGTGLGMHTTLGLSLLLGLANVRLGYWWDSGARPRLRRTDRQTPGRFGFHVETIVSWIFPVQIALVNELLGRFPGVARGRWNLSDGGHFENTGAYELIRRRVPCVIVCDNGCDPRCRFEDVANLARRVRTDFGAETVFLDRQTFEQHMGMPMPHGVGTLNELAAQADWPADGSAAHQVHAAVAIVSHPPPFNGEAQRTILLLVKPRLSGDEAVDVGEYKQAHGDFPNESTAEQFFNEAQWESYRKLGEHAAKTLFGAGKPTPLAERLFPTRRDVVPC